MKIILDDTIQCLILCCQKDVTEEDRRYIKNHLLRMSNLQIQNFIKQANQHAIVPLVYKTLSNIENIPPSLLTPLKKHYIHTVKKNMLMTSELLHIMQLLQDNHIKALAFKGPVLSQMAYGDITLRQYVDLDILINPSDAYIVGNLMSEYGYIPLLSLSILANQTCLHTSKDFSFISKSGLHIELHWSLFEKKFHHPLFSLTNNTMYQTVSINENHIKTLPQEILLIYLCLHGAKHTFSRIEWICDIDRLIRTTDINWHTAISLAKQLHSLRTFYLGLSLAKQFMHTPLSEEVTGKLHKHNTTVALKNFVLKNLKSIHKEKNNFIQMKNTFLFQAKLFDRKRDMIQFSFSTFFHISTTDCQLFSLPERVKFLYILLRPLRLLWNYSYRLYNYYFRIN